MNTEREEEYERVCSGQKANNGYGNGSSDIEQSLTNG